jgi:16S rRNA (cytosine1402-N4)-methyltransferase
MSRPYHLPVLAEEVVRYLNPEPGDTLVDGTAGGGGHALHLSEMLQPNGTLILIDQDPEALQEARNKLEDHALTIEYVHGNFRNVRSLLTELGVKEADGILLDLGVSSHQLDAAERGFSFRSEAPLDLRMDRTKGSPASDLLARLSERELTRILKDYGEERWAARIASFIVAERQRTPILTTTQLAQIVAAAIPKKAQPPDTHPATRTFQAIRIAVNEELDALEEGLEGSVASLSTGGRIAVISYHSLEDRIVKRRFARLAGACECPSGLPVCMCGARQTVRILTRKPVTPSEQEVRANPRSRSAKLRVAEKL